MKIKGFAYTNVGLKRKNNEDNFYLFGMIKNDINENNLKVSFESDSSQAVASVCDGMGGEACGELASLIAVKNIVALPYSEIVKGATSQIIKSNQLICDEMYRLNKGRIGTTISSIYFAENKAISCNVGDSRCYFFRHGILKQISKDHSEGQRLIDLGLVTEADAKNNHCWHKLTQHLGIYDDEFIIEPYFSEPVTIQNDDMFLICSDGLTDLVDFTEISNIMSNNNIENIANNLVDIALQNGGKDNVTVIVLKVVNDDNSITESNTKKYLARSEINNETVIKKNRFITALLIIVLLILLLWNINLLNSGKKYTNVITQLNEENQKLESDYKLLEIENQKLESDCKLLEIENQKSESDYELLEKENQKLKSDYELLEKENQKLKSDYKLLNKNETEDFSE